MSNGWGEIVRHWLGLTVLLWVSVSGFAVEPYPCGMLQWLSPTFVLAARPARVLGLPNGKDPKALKGKLGREWYEDLVTLGRMLELNPDAKSWFEDPKLPSTREAALEWAERLDVDLTSAQREILAETLVLTAERGEGGGWAGVRSAFQELVRAHWEREGETEAKIRERRKSLGRPILFGVRWEKRNGDVFRPVPSVVTARDGSFIQYERHPRSESIQYFLKDGKLNLSDGSYMFAIDRAGSLIVAPYLPGYPHPTLIGGRDPQVLSAGDFLVVGGRLVGVDDRSGHFRPTGTLPLVEKVFRDAVPPSAFHPDFAGFSDRSIIRLRTRDYE